METDKIELSDIKEFYKKHGAKFTAVALEKDKVTVNGKPFFDWYTDVVVPRARKVAEKVEFTIEVSPPWKALSDAGVSEDVPDLAFETIATDVEEVFGAFSSDMKKIYIGFDCWFNEEDFTENSEKWGREHLKGASEEDFEKIMNEFWDEYKKHGSNGSMLLVATFDGTAVGKFSIELTSDNVISKNRKQLFYPSLYAETKKLDIIPFRLD
jgi:hypothetical protein